MKKASRCCNSVKKVLQAEQERIKGMPTLSVLETEKRLREHISEKINLWSQYIQWFTGLHKFFIIKISTHLLTVLTTSVIVSVEQHEHSKLFRLCISFLNLIFIF